MAALRYGLRYALTRPRVVELSINAETSYELADWTVVVEVVRGISHQLPARLDPWFRHRVGRVRLSAAGGTDASGSIRETKLEAVLRMLPSYPFAELAMIDLDRCGDRLALTGGRYYAHLPADRSVTEGVTECMPGQLSIGRHTSEVILIGLSESEIGARKVVQAGSDALSALCGAKSLGRRSLSIPPSGTVTLVSVPTTV
ncbi:MAG: hypothetical protein NVS1B4_26720 [Gemmatimonadaceae bacterium]